MNHQTEQQPLLCQTPQQHQAWLDLRWQLLRAPWLDGSKRRVDESKLPDTQRALLTNHHAKPIACGQLTWPERGVAQIRNMAVDASVQGNGHGQSILRTLERWARARGAEKIIAMARDSALGFYQHHGYRIAEAGPMLFNQIPHHWVSKSLANEDFSTFGLKLCDATNDNAQELTGFIFKILQDFGLAPELDGIDQDLLNPEETYQGGLFKLLRDESGELRASLALLPRENNTVELRRMYLHPSLRGRGIGLACLSYAMRQARHLGFQHMSLETARVLSQAVSLYQMAGFTNASGERHARRCDLYMRLKDF